MDGGGPSGRVAGPDEGRGLPANKRAYVEEGAVGMGRRPPNAEAFGDANRPPKRPPNAEDRCNWRPFGDANRPPNRPPKAEARWSWRPRPVDPRKGAIEEPGDRLRWNGLRNVARATAPIGLPRALSAPPPRARIARDGGERPRIRAAPPAAPRIPPRPPTAKARPKDRPMGERERTPRPTPRPPAAAIRPIARPDMYCKRQNKINLAQMHMSSLSRRRGSKNERGWRLVTPGGGQIFPRVFSAAKI